MGGQDEPEFTAFSDIYAYACKFLSHPVNACKGEPLAELADRVNHKIVLIKNCNYPIGWIIHVQPKSATHLGGIEELPRGENVYTYAAAEQAARLYLNGLENKGGEK